MFLLAIIRLKNNHVDLGYKIQDFIFYPLSNLHIIYFRYKEAGQDLDSTIERFLRINVQI